MALRVLRVLYVDGGSYGNGSANQSARMAVFDATTEQIVVNANIGSLTNNEAEYRAIEAALDYARKSDIGSIEIRSDSQLCVSQITGSWKIKEPRLVPLAEACRAKLATNGGTITWIRRAQNAAGRHLEGLSPLPK